MKSRILFEQMLGRGTRKGEQYPDKTHFIVFDCFDGTLLEYFRNTTGMTAEPPERAGRTITQIIEEIWQNRDRDYNIRAPGQAAAAHRQGDVRRRPRAVRPVHPRRRRRRASPPTCHGSLRQSFAQTMHILRDPDFQQLLDELPARHAHLRRRTGRDRRRSTPSG